ncbi:MAG TPA: winged helix-turn-helix domain-containing protein [Stellaceae bacterium]|nr:winged helix-turn-helix domain-containing protein [Stellaceae bacterium]
MAARLTLRVDLGPGHSIGPGKMRLLDAIAETGSISSAGRTLGMSYRRAWMLIDDLNTSFKRKVVATTLGGKEGGGATLTPFGQELVKRYRAIETDAAKAARAHIAFLARALRGGAGAGAAKRTRLSR